jgi:hypothetical protein
MTIETPLLVVALAAGALAGNNPVDEMVVVRIRR